MGRHGLDVAQDRDTWWALVNAVMNFQVPQNEGNFLTRSEAQLLKKGSAPWSK